MTLKDFFKVLPKWKTIFLILSMIIAGFDGIILAQVVSSVTKFNSKSSMYELLALLSYGLIVYCVIQIAHMCVDFLTNNIIMFLNSKYKMLVLQALYSHTSEKKNSGDVVSLLTVDLNLIQEKYFSIILGSLYYFFMALISLAYLIYLSPTISLLFIICSCLPVIPALVFGKMLGNATEKYTHKNNEFIKNIKDFSQGYAEIVTYNAFSIFYNRTNETIIKMEKSKEILGNRHAFVGFITAMLSWLGYLIPIGVSLVFVINGSLSVSAVIALFLASDRVIMPFRNLSESLRFINSTVDTRAKIRRIISNSQIVEKNNSKMRLDKPTLIFNGVSFGFNDYLFENVSFTIPYGSKVLITGVSGSGKSTLLDLIQRHYEPITGTISIVDNDYNIALDSSLMARVYQDPYYFELTLRENLLMGLDDKTDMQLKKVLSSLGLLEELGDNCLDSMYGEFGGELSGGQKQRIEIARALIHNKKIILVDEGTSAVDEGFSSRIREILFGLEVTVLEVAHHYDFNTMEKNYSHHLEIINNKIYCTELGSFSSK